jgi:acetophenone carboxylase
MPGYDPGIQKRWAPEPFTEREKAAMEDIDPVALEIYGHRVFLITWEGRELVMKMGVTQGLSAGDLNTGLHTVQGDLAITSTGVHYHSCTAQIMTKYVLSHFGDDPSVGVKDGDIFFCNSPLVGAVHTPDNYVFTPIFHKGELIAFAACGAHQVDVGASSIGMNPFANNRFEEGVTFPPARIGQNFEMMNDIMNVIAMSTRDPRSITLDTKAKVAAVMRMRQRVLEIAEKKGSDFVIGLLAKLIEVGEEQFRKRLLAYNDGTFRHVVFFDSIGISDSLIAIVLTLTKRGDEITVDLTGSSPHIPVCAVNSVPQVLAASFAVRAFNRLGHDLWRSGGIFKPVKFINPEGCIFSSPQDAAVGASVALTFALEHGYQSCFNKMIFDSEQRDTIGSIPSAGINIKFMGGINQRGLLFTLMSSEINTHGGGASYAGGDGVDVYGPVWEAVCDGMNGEALERDNPILYLFRKHSMDTAGMGKYRGGCGMDAHWIIHNTPMCVVGGAGNGAKFVQASGSFGGYAPTAFPGVLVKGSDILDRMKRGEDVPLSTQEVAQKPNGKGEVVISDRSLAMFGATEGDEISVLQAGGGGYGDVLDRDPDAVLRDLQGGVISRWVAENVCHVAIDSEVRTVDYRKTEELRAREIKNRKQRGRKYGDFIKEWREKRPPAEAIAYIGPWPESDG